jgi:Flp pilus assembly protein TadG
MRLALYRRQQRGQSTVEFALILPLAVACMVFVLTAGIIVYDHLALSDLSRSAVRAAVVSDDPAATAKQLVTLVDDSIRVQTTVDSDSGLVIVKLDRQRAIPLPLISDMLPSFRVRASAAMMVEPPLVIGDGLP